MLKAGSAVIPLSPDFGWPDDGMLKGLSALVGGAPHRLLAIPIAKKINRNEAFERILSPLSMRGNISDFAIRALYSGHPFSNRGYIL
jgi:hypothetical protein